ncbi:MAG: prolyl oligopeptidase family serine peptidase [Pseudomonadota bacterium]
MKFLKASAAAALVGASILGLSVAAPSETQAQATSTSSVPVDVWALRNVVNRVELSPDGKHLLVHVSPSREGDYLLQIFNTEDLSKPMRTLAADPMEIISASWVSNTQIYGSAWQVVRNSVKRQEGDTRGYASFFYDLDANKFDRVDGNFGLVNRLPNDPDKILVSTGTAVGAGAGSDPLARFRPRSYYKFNLSNGSRELVLRGTSKYGQVVFDNEANPRYALGVDGNDTVAFFRRPGEGSWREFGRYDGDDLKNVPRTWADVSGLKGFDPENPDIGYFVDWQGEEDKAALYELDFKTGTLGKKLFQSESADVLDIQLHSIPGNDKLVAARFPGAKMERHWFDENEKALYEALESQLPFAHQVSITSRSYDGRTMVVFNSGPQDPGSYWLVRDGKLAKLGSRNPLVNQENLAEVEFIRYPSRDGKFMIPGYVTKPKGEGPFPLVVMPHGGPMVNEVVGYDEWAQMLANNGYMVLQPQYRVTYGWGRDHFLAGFGEYGRAMQDDKDDGALYLAEQGLVDPDRMAMFGWSYGGYAALVAASREDNIYQCAVAGAAVSNWTKLKQVWGRNISSGVEQYWLDTAYGVNPVDEASKANIPLLMVHPKDDRRVLYYHFQDYKKEFEKAGRNGQFVTIDGADHFSNTHMFNHMQQFYTKMLDFLANDCGPGGL